MATIPAWSCAPTTSREASGPPAEESAAKRPVLEVKRYTCADALFAQPANPIEVRRAGPSPQNGTMSGSLGCLFGLGECRQAGGMLSWTGRTGTV